MNNHQRTKNRYAPARVLRGLAQHHATKRRFLGRCLGIALLCSSALTTGATPSICKEPEDPRPGKIEVGLLYSNIVPNGYAGIGQSIPSIGPRLGAPIGPGTVQLSGWFGSLGGLSISLAALSYRLNLPTPFLNTFLSAGAHYLDYSIGAQAESDSNIGANFELGISSALGGEFELHFSLQTFINQRILVGLGGGFSFLL